MNSIVEVCRSISEGSVVAHRYRGVGLVGILSGSLLRVRLVEVLGTLRSRHHHGVVYDAASTHSKADVICAELVRLALFNTFFTALAEASPREIGQRR